MGNDYYACAATTHKLNILIYNPSTQSFVLKKVSAFDLYISHKNNQSMPVNLLVSQLYVISIYAAFIFVTLVMNSQ